MWVMPSIDPVILPIYGPLALRWYGLMYVVGLGSIWFLASLRIKCVSGWHEEHIQDMLLWGLLGAVIGGRVGYMLFYTEDISLMAWLYLWEGGMSFHGGFVGGALAFMAFAHKWNKRLVEVADFFLPMVPIALAFGRIGNFINGELWGRPTDMPWGVLYTWSDVARHPSQLYESALEGIVLFTVLWCYSRKPRAPWAVSALFLIGYSTARLIAECFREPDRHIGFIFQDWLTMGQLLSLPMLFAGMVLWWYSRMNSHQAKNL